MGTAWAEQETEKVFTCHHVQRLQLLWVRKKGDMDSSGTFQHNPAPTSSASELLSHSCLSMMGGTAVALAPAPRDGTASQPLHTDVLAQEPAFPTILSIFATAGPQRQSQAGVTPCHSTSPRPWQWQQVQGAAFLSPTTSFLPVTAHKRAGGIRTDVTLLAADAPGISDSGEQREPSAAPEGAAVALSWGRGSNGCSSEGGRKLLCFLGCTCCCFPITKHHTHTAVAQASQAHIPTYTLGKDIQTGPKSACLQQRKHRTGLFHPLAAQTR